MNDDLQHYGVKGMKWGVRRFQPYPKGSKNAGKFRDARKKKNEGRVSKAREGIKKGISENQSMAKDSNQSAEWKKRATRSVSDLKNADKKLANIDTEQSRRATRKQIKSITNEANDKAYADAGNTKALRREKQRVRKETEKEVVADFQKQLNREVQSAIAAGDTKKIQELGNRVYDFNPVIDSETSRKMVSQYGQERMSQFERSESTKAAAKTLGILAVAAGSGIALASLESR